MKNHVISEGLGQPDLPDSCEIEANDAGTVDQNDTGLTQWRSPTVRTEALLGYTYFIRVGQSIKIGSATDFKRRLGSLQTSHEKPLEVLAVVPATIADEYTVHQLFAKLRTRGEWFRADRELLYFIDKVKADAESEAAGVSAAPQPSAFDRARRNLYALRKGHPANDPLARCCHNFLEQIDNYQAAESDEQKSNLRRAMRGSEKWLRQLTAAA